MPAIKSFTMTHDALNENGTFSEGDTLSGKVSLALLKETSVESLFVKLKGDADVRWTTKSGDNTHVHNAHRRYFKLKHFLIPTNIKDTVLPQGVHNYNFSFNIPHTIPTGSLPSSFKGNHGKIVYKLEAKLSRSWRMDRTLEQELRFVSYPNLLSLKSRQVGSTKKEMGLFSKGHANMEVIVDKTGYAPGETMAIVAKINNSSSKEMTPKFSLIQDVVFRANSSTKQEGKVIHKVVDQCIKSQTQKDIRCAIQIPRDQVPSILNCEIISVEYHLKAYLDISFASDPEIMFPVVIIQPDLARGPRPGAAAGPYPARAVGGPSNSDFPPPAAASMGPYPPRDIRGPSDRDFSPPAASMGRYPVSPHSGSYGYPGTQRSPPPPAYPGNPQMSASPPGLYPAQPSGAYNNPVPQLASPYGSPFSSSSSSSVLHPPPNAPTFQPAPSAPGIYPSPPPFPPPPPPPPPFYTYPSAPTYNSLPSAAMMNTDFLSQSDEAPPAYSLLFPSSATDRSDAK